MEGMSDDGGARPLGEDRSGRRVVHQRGLRWADPESGDHYGVRLRYAVMDDRVECTEFLVFSIDAPITASVVRRIPVGRLAAEDLGSAKQVAEAMAASTALSEEDREALRQLRPAHDGPTPGRARITTDQLIEVAEVYMAARVNPTQAVREHFEKSGRKLSYSTAAKWVMRARAVGFLPPASTGSRRKEEES